MIGLDTNVLIRHLTQDEPDQARQASELIADACSLDEPGYINRVVICEVVWVLERAYGRTPAEISAVLMGLLETEELVLEEAAEVATAAQAYGEGAADFADHMIAAAALRAGCQTLYTFDRKAARHNAVTLLVK